jgi:hypothetical protein
VRPILRRIAVLLIIALAAVACSRFRHAVGPDQGKLVASRTGQSYHRLDCSYAKHIHKRHRLYYKTGDDAYQDRFAPCERCHPEPADGAPPAAAGR